MKKLKLHTIISSIIYMSYSAQTYGMGQMASDAASAIVKTFSTVTVAAAGGLQNMISGYADPLITDIDNSKVDPDFINRNHKYDRAVRELIQQNNISKLHLLMTKVQDHNTQRPTLMLSMSKDCEELIRTPLQIFYDEIHKKLITDTKTSMQAMIDRWHFEHQELIALTLVQQAYADRISQSIASVQGKKPDDLALSKQLEELLVIQRYKPTRRSTASADQTSPSPSATHDSDDNDQDAERSDHDDGDDDDATDPVTPQSPSDAAAVSAVLSGSPTPTLEAGSAKAGSSSLVKARKRDKKKGK